MTALSQTTKTVFHVIGGFDPGGVESWLIGLAAETRPYLRTRVCVLGSAPGSQEDVAKAAGAEIIRCPLRPALSFPLRFLRLLWRERPDVLHAHVHTFSGYLLMLGRLAGVPRRVAHSHNTADGRGHSLGRRLYRHVGQGFIRAFATHGIAASGVTGDGLFGAHWRQDARFSVIRCGVNPRDFVSHDTSPHLRRELGLPERASVVGHVGRFDAQKNHRFFIDVARAISVADATIRFLFVGDGPLRSEIEARARDAGIADRCVFVGRRRDVPRILLNAMDVLLFPSLWEGLPVVLIEAQAAGLPVVASKSITAESSIVPGLVTFLELSGGVHEWAACVRARLEAGRMSPTAAYEQFMRSGFDIRTSASQVLDLYGLKRPTEQGDGVLARPDDSDGVSL